MVNFPIEILSDILVRLPLKSIARFRCVNNEWHSLLKNPEFLETQYQHAVEMDKFSLILHGNNNIYTLNYDPLSSTCDRSGHVILPVENGIEFFGCSNGLVLLKHTKNSVLMLWNPCTNECKRVPNPPGASKDRDVWHLQYGFGYDSQNEDFKVVCLAGFIEEGFCEVHVYTHKSNSWRKVDYVEMDEFQTDIFDMGRLPVNGSLYWIASEDPSESGRFVLCFDIEKEEFDKIPLPYSDVYQERILCVFGGSLRMFYFHFEDILVWELKDDGIKKSWARLFNIDIEKHFAGDFRDLIPLRTLKNGKVLLGIDLGPSYNDFSLRMVIYDPKQDTVVHIHEESMACTRAVAVYGEEGEDGDDEDAGTRDDEEDIEIEELKSKSM